MNGFDFFIIAIIGLAAVRGLFRGFVKEVFSLLGIAGGIYFGLKYNAVVIDYLRFLKNPSLMKAVAFVIVFIVIYVLITLLGVAVAKLFRALLLSFVDRILGAVFGAAEGVFIVAAILYLFSLFPWGDEILRESKVAETIFEIVRSFLSGGETL